MRRYVFMIFSVIFTVVFSFLDIQNKKDIQMNSSSDSLGIKTSVLEDNKIVGGLVEGISLDEKSPTTQEIKIEDSTEIEDQDSNTSVVTPKPTSVFPPSISPTKSPTSTPTAILTPTATSIPTPTVVPTSTSTPTPSPTFDYSVPWPVANGCPATTLSCVPCTSGWACRYEPGETHGFQGWSCQNNNPGNIRNSSTNMATDFKNKIIVRNGGVAACGVRYDFRGGSYFVFSSYSAGMRSLKAYIKGIANGEHGSYVGCGECTIAYFFSKYAPGDSGYATYVANYIGEPTTQTLNYVVANKLDNFAEAIKTHEGFFVK